MEEPTLQQHAESKQPHGPTKRLCSCTDFVFRIGCMGQCGADPSKEQKQGWAEIRNSDAIPRCMIHHWYKAGKVDSQFSHCQNEMHIKVVAEHVKITAAQQLNLHHFNEKLPIYYLAMYLSMIIMVVARPRQISTESSRDGAAEFVSL